MQIPDFFVQDGDTLKLYPSKLYIAIWATIFGTLLVFFMAWPLQTTMATSEYYVVLLGTCFSATLFLGFARELWHREPILVLTKKTITTRGIPFYRPKTLNLADVDDIKLVHQRRNSFIFIYKKAENQTASNKPISIGAKWFSLDNPQNLVRHHLIVAFLPCPVEALVNFLIKYTLANGQPNIVEGVVEAAQEELEKELGIILNQAALQSLKKPDLVIFDCDGVLVDGEVLSYETYAKVFTQENFAISPDDLMHRYSGLSLADMIAEIEKTGHIRFSSAILEKIDQAIREVFMQKLKPVSGVIELLEELKQQNIPVCLVSNGLRSRVDCALKATGLKKYFPENQIFDVSLVKRGKPAPDLLMYAAWATDKNPGRCVAIDDSVTGITAARAADMPVIGFLGGAHATGLEYQANVKAAKPTALAYSMDDVAKLLLPQ